MPDWFVEITEGNFDELVIESRTPVLVDFWAAWCGPCQVMAPVISELAIQFGGQVAFAKCDIDTQPVIAQRFGIESVPTIILFNKGEAVEIFSGLTRQQRIAESIVKVIPADVTSLS